MKISAAFLIPYCLVCIAGLSGIHAWWSGDDQSHINVLVFGGNGFIGSDTVTQLLESGIQNITTVNRGGVYWDSADRIFAKVKNIKCDRDTIIGQNCEELIAELKENSFDFVIDFSASKPNQMNETLQLLKDKVGLYILLSPDQIYDVCNKTHEEFTKETDAVRPIDDAHATMLNHHYKLAHKRLQVEELLVQQEKDGGVPYVILRLPDVFGPRDTTYRWWIYQLWLRLSPVLTEHPIHIPSFLESHQLSFVYSKDVAKIIGDILQVFQTESDKVKNQVFNLAWPEALTMTDVLQEIRSNLDIQEANIQILDELSHQNHFYTYPSTRSGPLNVEKATEALKWTPTDWKSAVKETVSFFEQAMKDGEFPRQRDEIIQIAGQSLYKKNLMKFYESLEEIYNIDLKHFKFTKDEL